MKINIGCGWRNFGDDWIHIDGGDYSHLDSKNIFNLPYEDNSVDLIYASHVLEYFDINEVKPILHEWKRVLKPYGIIRIAVPDFEAMNLLYYNGRIKLKDIIGPLYGRMKMGDEMIYHKTVYDYELLHNLLDELLFNNISRYNWKHYEEHKQNDDHSQAYLDPKGDKDNGPLISLNIEARK